MQTFSQYAATRLLREHPARAQTFGGIAIKTGSVQTFAGIDLITGMPVFIYTMPEKPSAIAEVYSEFIPTVLEFGFEHNLGFVITGSAPGYTPLKPILTQARLEWLVRSSSRALADAHAVGLIHGNLEPAHFFASGDHLLLEGWGLPWGQANADYQAPETNISLATDIFAWARSVTMFGKGKPRLMLDGEFGRLIGHCLNPRPSERPTAQELVLALEQVLPPRNPTPPDLAETALELSATEFLESDRDSSTPIKRTKPLEIPVKSAVEAVLESKHSKPELPMLIEPAPAITAKLEPVKIEVVSEPPAESDASSPEAKLDAFEAEFSKSLVPVLPKLETEETQAIVSLPLEFAETVLAPEPVPPPEPVMTPEVKLEVWVQPEPIPTVIVTEPAQLSEPEHLAADEPDVAVPTRASSRVTDDSDAPRPAPIRIGFDDDDHSWRSVVTPSRPQPRLGRWIALAVLLGALIVMAGVLLGQPLSQNSVNPRPLAISGSSSSVVIFNLRGVSNLTGRLIVVTVPAGSKTAVGSLLATIPGPVAFDAVGEYKLKIEVPNCVPSEIIVRVPAEKLVNVETCSK